MNVTVLMENTALEGCGLTPEAGLSLYIDFRGRSLVAYSGEWPVGYLLKHNPGLALEEPS